MLAQGVNPGKAYARDSPVGTAPEEAVNRKDRKVRKETG
jgi:hypothetical protein